MVMHSHKCFIINVWIRTFDTNDSAIAPLSLIRSLLDRPTGCGDRIRCLAGPGCRKTGAAGDLVFQNEKEEVFKDCSGGNSRPSHLSGVGGGNFSGKNVLRPIQNPF
jgi:hypothetical protein